MPQAPALRIWRENTRLGAISPEWFAVGAFAIAMTVLYIWGGQGQGNLDGFFPLSDSMLHGHLSIDGSRTWIEMAKGNGGLWYLPFPPIPAVVLIPGTALFGPSWADTSGTTGFVGGVNIVLVWMLTRQLGLSTKGAAWITVFFAIGSEAMYVAWAGGPHHWVQTLGLMFALMAMILAVRGKWPLLGGALLLLAAGCRPTFLLGGIAYLALYLVRRPPIARREMVRRIALFCVGALPIGLFLLWYNWARFGTPLEFGYTRIISAQNGASVLSEPWYAQGIESITYWPRGLYTVLLRSFQFTESFPWLQPSWAGASVLLTMPVLIYLRGALSRSPWVLAGWVALLAPLAMDLAHGNPGYAQFGYRFILDAMPGIIVLLAIVVRERGLTTGFKAAVIAGIVVNAYGLVAISTGFMSS